MKRLPLIVLVLSIVVMLLASLAFATDKIQLTGKTFTTIAGDQPYTMTFQQGPFGPGEGGTATLSDLSGTEFLFSYQFEDPFCLIEQSFRFVLVLDKLLCVPPDTLTFTEE